MGESLHRDYTNYSNGLPGRVLRETAYRAFSFFGGYEGFKSVRSLLDAPSVGKVAFCGHEIQNPGQRGVGADWGRSSSFSQNDWMFRGAAGAGRGYGQRADCVGSNGGDCARGGVGI